MAQIQIKSHESKKKIDQYLDGLFMQVIQNFGFIYAPEYVVEMKMKN